MFEGMSMDFGDLDCGVGVGEGGVLIGRGCN